MRIVQTSIAYALLMMLGLSTAAAADAKAPVISWSGVDINGAKLRVPAEKRISILAFVRADQPQSREALLTLKKAVTDSAGTQVIVFVSGQSASDQAKAMATGGECPWPIVADTDFVASGNLGAHVWPTTVIVRADGEQAGHLAGMPISYASDLQAYMEFANQKIDQAALQQRLSSHEVVQDDATQAAHRHLEVARRLLETGEVEKARDQLSAGLKLRPGDPALSVMLAKVMLQLDQPKSAAELLDKLPPGSVPSWQVSLLRGKSFIQMEQWDQAKAILPEALKLNPSPGEAHYLLGVTHQHTSDWVKAAEEFRKAYESVPSVEKLPVKK